MTIVMGIGAMVKREECFGSNDCFSFDIAGDVDFGGQGGVEESF